MKTTDVLSNQPLPRIIKILAIEPFSITALWTTAEIRRNDFKSLSTEWKRQEDTRLFLLFEYENFEQVTVSPARTLQWPNVPIKLELGHRTIEGSLELDPDELYRQSELLRKTERLAIGPILKQARQAAGLSQEELAAKSGTTRNYISRIENGRSDIQLETLNKIVQLGIGKQLRVEIA